MKKLSDLPNIGKTLEEKLLAVGISSPEELMNKGSENALMQIRAIDNTACFSMLCALEGAIQGIRWHGLSVERKEELKQFLKMKNIPINPMNK
ncbi:MAG: TfoX/Sxy family protein [Bacteroidales bacterium]|nr:TfoX/Sxy family protein [Bacteroidales bacterium]MCF8402866.1 TfoX/Sxy family protein [Bacteroidales bacterium]